MFWNQTRTGNNLGGCRTLGVDLGIYKHLLNVLVGIEDEVLGTLNLLQMDLGVLEGQTSRGLFSNSIFDPSVIGASVHP